MSLQPLEFDNQVQETLSLLAPALWLRPCREQDAPVLHAMLHDPLVAKGYYVDIEIGREQDRDRRWVQLPNTWEEHRSFQLTAVSRLEDKIVGGLRLFEESLDYFLAPPFWGAGLGSQLVRASCAVLPPLLGLESLHAEVLSDNPASRRILERLGFQRCGLIWLDLQRALLRYRLTLQHEGHLWRR